MFTQKPNLRRLVMVSAVGICAWSLAQAAENGKYDIGEPVTQQQIAGWNIDVSPSGENLPAGKGSVAEGEKIYANKCASCHGDKGQGKPMDKLVGGQGSAGLRQAGQDRRQLLALCHHRVRLRASGNAVQ